MGVFKGLIQAAKDVWHYVASAVRSDVPAEVLSDIIKPISEVASLQTIRNFFGYYDQGLKAWSKIVDIPFEHIVTDTFSLETVFDYSQKHVMKMKIQGIDLQTGEEVNTWITAESDRALSRSQWLDLGQEAVQDSIFGYSYDVQYVSEYEYYVKTETL